MPIALEIIPHVGVPPIKLSSNRQAVRQALSDIGFLLESESEVLDYFCDSSIQVEYGDTGEVEFIGLSYSSLFTVDYRGVNVFDTPARELFAHINQFEESPSEYDGYEYVFPHQIMTLWHADSQYDKIGGEQRDIWAQVGVGSMRYYEAINA